MKSKKIPIFLALLILSLVIEVGCTFSCPEGSQQFNISNEMGKVQGCNSSEHIPSGDWTWWHANGKVWRKGSYEQGRPIGRWDTWFNTGLQQAVFHYTQSSVAPDHSSVPHETWEHWYPNGKLRYRVPFNHGAVEGLASIWYESGAKKIEGSFIKGQRTGVWTAWRSNGQIAGRGTYDETGHPIGKWVTFKPDGSENSTREGTGPWSSNASVSPTTSSVTYQASDTFVAVSTGPRDLTLATGPALSPLVPYAVDSEYPLSQINGVWFDEFRIELGFSSEELK